MFPRAAGTPFGGLLSMGPSLSPFSACMAARFPIYLFTFPPNQLIDFLVDSLILFA